MGGEISSANKRGRVGVEATLLGKTKSTNGSLDLYEQGGRWCGVCVCWFVGRQRNTEANSDNDCVEM